MDDRETGFPGILPEGLRVAVNLCAPYMRVSTDRQRERHTIDSQRPILLRLMKEYNLAPFDWYVDDGISGTTIDDRPAFKRLLEDAKAKKFQYVIVVEFERHTRPSNLLQLALIKEIFLEAGIKLIMPGKIIDPADDEDDFWYDLQGILSKREIRKTRERCQRGIDKHRKAGKYIMGTPPLPYYRDDNGVMLVDEEKKKTVLMLLEAGRQMGILALGLRYPHHRGILRRLFDRKRLVLYAGFTEYEGRQIKGEWPPIITMEEVEEILQSRRQRRKFKEHKTPRFLLTGLGLFLCGVCGRTIGSHSDSATRPARGKIEARRYYRQYYQCNHRPCEGRSKIHPADPIDQAVLRRLGRQIERVGFIRGFIEEHRARSTDTKEIARIDRQIAEEEARKKNLIQATARGVFSFEEVRVEAEAVRARLAEFAAARAALIGKTESRLDVSELAALEGVDLEEMDLAGRRAVLRACIHRIVLHEKNLFIYYRFPIDKEGKNKERITRVK